MNTAINPLGQSEVCTRSETPFFEGDMVLAGGWLAVIDTVDLDGDESRCRIRPLGSSKTDVVLVGELRKP